MDRWWVTDYHGGWVTFEPFDSKEEAERYAEKVEGKAWYGTPKYAIDEIYK